MKTIVFLTIMFTGTNVFAQSGADARNIAISDKIVALSNDKFRWEMKNDADSMDNLLDERFVGVSSTGIRRTKKEYLANIKNPTTIHNSMEIQETNVMVFGNTAVLTGKGIFVITSNNVQSTQHLCYMQVFVQTGKEWKMVALQGSRLPD
jgi:hypothetical protein